MENYNYRTPPGYGDTFFVYAFDADASGANLTPGLNYFNQRIVISDGSFLSRWWRGVDQYGNVSNSIQIRDRLSTPFFSDLLSPASVLGNAQDYQNSGWGIVPEVHYPDSGYIGFDLVGVLPNAALPGQLAFHGVRRRKGIQNDPVPSLYPYYEKPYQYQVSPTLPIGWSNSSGGYLATQVIDEFDFELRRIDGVVLQMPATASREYGDDQAVVLVTAVTPGAAGNNITIVLDKPGPFPPNQAEQVTVVGTTITYLPATNSLGQVIYNPPTQGTNLQLLNAFANSAAASALVTMTLYGGPLTTSGYGKIPSPGNLQGGSAGAGGATYCGLDKGNYKILLLDTNGIQVSNVPLLFSNLFHVPNNVPVLASAATASQSIPKNYWPTPAMLYKVNTSLRFYLYTTSATPLAAPVSFDLLFSGVRRYPCH
jgi:hypothetical protein